MPILTNRETLFRKATIILDKHKKELIVRTCSCRDELRRLIDIAYLLGAQHKVKERECPLCSIRGDLQRELIGNKDEWFCPNEGCPIRFYEA